MSSTVSQYLKEIDRLSGRTLSSNLAKAPHFFSFLLSINPSLKLTPTRVLERATAWEGTLFLVKRLI